jgi:hypothetical protein
MRPRAWWWLACLAVAVEAQAPSPKPTPTAAAVGPTTVQPVAPVGPRSGEVKAAPATPTATAAGKYDGSLAGVKALEIRDGRARLMIGGGERVVTPGAVIGADTVKSITPGRIVLKRSAPDREGGEAIVIVTFDAQGATRVQVIAVRDPTARAPAEVK